jgi:hypothetical protein
MSVAEPTTIWKFILSNAVDDISMPLGARVISAGIDPNNDLCVWAEVNPSNAYTFRSFMFLGTGMPIPKTPEGKTRKFIGTANRGPLIWHIYEIVDTCHVILLGTRTQ